MFDGRTNVDGKETGQEELHDQVFRSRRDTRLDIDHLQRQDGNIDGESNDSGARLLGWSNNSRDSR